MRHTLCLIPTDLKMYRILTALRHIKLDCEFWDLLDKKLHTQLQGFTLLPRLQFVSFITSPLRYSRRKDTTGRMNLTLPQHRHSWLTAARSSPVCVCVCLYMCTAQQVRAADVHKHTHTPGKVTALPQKTAAARQAELVTLKVLSLRDLIRSPWQ